MDPVDIMHTDPMATEPAPTREDRRLLRRTVLAHLLGIWVLILVLVLLIAWGWARLAQAVLAFGLDFDFRRFNVAGPEALSMLERINPWFWWVLVGLLTLIVLRILFALGRSLLAHARLRRVRPEAFQRLAGQLSAPALDVLLWAWPSTDEPLRVGDVQHAAAELVAHRATRLQTARHQRRVLQDALQARQNGQP